MPRNVKTLSVSLNYKTPNARAMSVPFVSRSCFSKDDTGTPQDQAQGLHTVPTQEAKFQATLVKVHTTAAIASRCLINKHLCPRVSSVVHSLRNLQGTLVGINLPDFHAFRLRCFLLLRRLRSREIYEEVSDNLSMFCYRSLEFDFVLAQDRKSTRLNSSHRSLSRMPSSA